MKSSHFRIDRISRTWLGGLAFIAAVIFVLAFTGCDAGGVERGQASATAIRSMQNP